MAKARVEFDPELKTVYEAIKDTNPGSLLSLKSTNETALSTLASSVNSCLETLTSTDTWNDAVSSKIKSASSTITSLIDKCKEPGGTILTTAQGATSALQASLQEYDDTLKELNEHIDKYNNLEANEPTAEETKTTTNADGTSTSTKKETDAHKKWKQNLAEEDEIIALKQQELDGYKATCDSLIAQLKGILSSIESEASIAGLAMKFGMTRQWTPDAKDIDEKFSNSDYKVKGTETVDEDGNVLSRTYTIYDKNGKIVQTGVIKYDAGGKEISRTSKNDYGKDPDAPDKVDPKTEVKKVVGQDGNNYNAEELQNGTIRIRDEKGNTVEILSKEEYEKKYKDYVPEKAPENKKEVVKLENGNKGTAEYQENGTIAIYDEKGNVVEILSKDEYEKKYKGSEQSKPTAEEVEEMSEEEKRKLAEKAIKKAQDDGKKLTEELKQKEKEKEESSNADEQNAGEDISNEPKSSDETVEEIEKSQSDVEEAKEQLIEGFVEAGNTREQAETAANAIEKLGTKVNELLNANNEKSQTGADEAKEQLIEGFVEAGNTREQAETAANAIEKLGTKVNEFLDGNNKSEKQDVNTQNSLPRIPENETNYYEDWNIKNEGNGEYNVKIFDIDDPEQPSYSVKINNGANLETIKNELEEGNAGKYYMSNESLGQIAEKIYSLINNE